MEGHISSEKMSWRVRRRGGEWVRRKSSHGADIDLLPGRLIEQ